MSEPASPSSVAGSGVENSAKAVAQGENAVFQQAISLLDTVPGAGAPAGGYERNQFGSGWKDTDHNGCDTRNDVLARDLTDVEFKPGTHECVVVSGNLEDPYSGKEISFLKGNETSTLVQIDHIVPLSWAWKYGASLWTLEQREQFANDPENLLAVDENANLSKSDNGPSGWLPTSSFVCTYSSKWVDLLIKYRLHLPSSDKNALKQILTECSNKSE